MLLGDKDFTEARADATCGSEDEISTVFHGSSQTITENCGAWTCSIHATVSWGVNRTRAIDVADLSIISCKLNSWRAPD